MKSKTKLIISIVLVSIVFVLLFIRNKNTTLLTQEPEHIDKATSTVRMVWEEYTNTKYKFSLQRPNIVSIQPVQEMEGLPPEESSLIEMFVGGGVPTVGIYIAIMAPYSYKTSDPIALEYNRVARLDLKSFSEAQRQKFIADKNPNFPNKKITDLKEITFANQKAYTATVTGYMDGYGSETFSYIYLDEGEYKLVIQYSLNGDLSKQIINTFRFIDTNKKQYHNTTYQFHFSYPSSWTLHDGNLTTETLRLFNYNQASSTKDFSSNSQINKIEATIVTSNTNEPSSDYPEKSRNVSTILVDNTPTKVFDVELSGGQKIRSYYVPLVSGKYLMTTIYGDEKNFYVLDDIMKTFTFE